MAQTLLTAQQSPVLTVKDGAIMSQPAGIAQWRQADSFTNWCRELFSEEMCQAAELLEQACDLYLQQLFRSLDLGSRLQEPTNTNELREDLGFVESADIMLSALLRRLASRTMTVRLHNHCEVLQFSEHVEPGDVSAQLDQVRRAMAELGPEFASAMEFLDFGAQHFVRCLRDDPTFMDRVLTGREKEYRELWHKATNLDPLQDVHGMMGARVICELGGGGEILEIGGGTGNGIRHLCRELASCGELPRVRRYVFTDVSTAFVLGTRRELRNCHPSLPAEWRLLDINRPFGDQKFTPESFDFVYGVNAAHCATDTLEFLNQCMSVLRPGGSVVFAERVRQFPDEMAPRELTLNLSDYHRTAARRNPQWRPAHAYLTPENWLTVLGCAGFQHTRILPDLRTLGQVLPTPYAAVIVGTKPTRHVSAVHRMGSYGPTAT